MMYPSGATVVVVAGIVTILVTGSVVSGIIVSTLIKGDEQKAKMLRSQSPPPPPSPSSGRRLEKEELYGKGSTQFELTKQERAVFTTLARRESVA
tara:strand:+ start:520 stop:804 length:285 start_codon:yes stop_codon:yes gene_type:complete